MFRFVLAASALALAACAPPIPDSGKGVGFESYSDYNSYRATRDNELRSESLPPPAPVATTSIAGEAPITSATLSQAGIGAQPTTTTTVATTPPAQGRVVAIPENDANISDEQNFAAVANRQTIESDAERLRAQRQAYEVIAPTALPTRSGSEGPNIVQFALNTSNAVGQQVHSRSALSGSARYQRNCGKYPSPDLAQEAFLRSGGPERDKLGIDPDGDGFACAWNPAPFRKVSSNG